MNECLYEVHERRKKKREATLMISRQVMTSRFLALKDIRGSDALWPASAISEQRVTETGNANTRLMQA